MTTMTTAKIVSGFLTLNFDMRYPSDERIQHFKCCFLNFKINITIFEQTAQEKKAKLNELFIISTKFLSGASFAYAILK